MTITISGQILAALRNNPGLNSARIASMIGMTTKKISGPLSTLFADGLIEFEGKHGQRLYRLTSYGMKYAPETIPAMPKGNSKKTIYEPIFIVAEHIESFLFAGVSHIKMTSGEKIVVRETPEEILALLGVDIQTDSLKTWADIAQQEAAQ